MPNQLYKPFVCSDLKQKDLPSSFLALDCSFVTWSCDVLFVPSWSHDLPKMAAAMADSLARVSTLGIVSDYSGSWFLGLSLCNFILLFVLILIKAKGLIALTLVCYHLPGLLALKQ